MLIGLCAGVLSGFTGVGGAFMVTPALIVIGMPAHLAVGTSLMWVFGNSVVGAFRHNRLGNVDFKMGILLTVSSMFGVEVGVRLLNMVKNIGIDDTVVLIISICLLLIIGVYALCESLKKKKELDSSAQNDEEITSDNIPGSLARKVQGIKLPPMLYFGTSGITISLWIILLTGFIAGVLSGLIGVGGGIIKVPALIYMIGLSPFLAVGTSLLQVIFTGLYGSIRYSLTGDVVIFAAVIMVLTSSIGVVFGATATRYVRGISLRITLGITALAFALGAALKLAATVMQNNDFLQLMSMIVTFGFLLLILLAIIVLYIMAILDRRGRKIPSWSKTFIGKDS